MENGNEKKVKKIINIIIAIIVLALIVVIGIMFYRNHLQTVNNNKFTTYLENNNYQKECN